MDLIGVPTLYLFDRWDERIGILPTVGSLAHTEELSGEDTVELDCLVAPEKGDRILWRDPEDGRWQEHEVVRTDEAAGAYMGRVGETFEDLLGRDFSTSRPWEKLATDVTEFVQPWGKAYLAPVLGLCGNRVVSWSISLSPNMEQQEEMLAGLWGAMPEGATPTLHSDMGWQHQHSGYVGQLRSHGVRQSMSRKGNCLDNACVEGLCAQAHKPSNALDAIMCRVGAGRQAEGPGHPAPST